MSHQLVRKLSIWFFSTLLEQHFPFFGTVQTKCGHNPCNVKTWRCPVEHFLFTVLSVLLTKMCVCVCVSLRFNSHVECISFSINYLHFCQIFKRNAWFVSQQSSFSLTLLALCFLEPFCHLQISVLQLAEMCMASQNIVCWQYKLSNTPLGTSQFNTRQFYLYSQYTDLPQAEALQHVWRTSSILKAPSSHKEPLVCFYKYVNLDIIYCIDMCCFPK